MEGEVDRRHGDEELVAERDHPLCTIYSDYRKQKVKEIDNKKIILEYMSIYAIIYMYIRVLKYGRPVKWVLNYY